MKKLTQTLLIASLLAGGIIDLTAPSSSGAMAKGAKPYKGHATNQFKGAATTRPATAAGRNGGRPPKPPVAATSAPPPKPPKKLTPIFNHAAKPIKPPTKPDKPIPTLKPQGPTFTPGGI